MPLRIAVVGAGHMGRIHLEKLKIFEGIQIPGVVDIEEKLLKDVSRKYQIPSYKDYRKLLDSLDGVIIATPTETHYKIARDFLEHNTHVFIEKPITSQPEEANELIEIAHERGLVLEVGHLERFNPAFAKAFSSIKKPVFIEAYRASGFTGRSTDVDVVLDLMIHDIDLTLSFVRGEAREVKAQGISLVTDKLDMVNARIEFIDGCVASLTASRMSAKKERTFKVFEKDRYFYIDLLNGSLVSTIRNKSGKIETTEYTTEKVDSVKSELIEFIHSIKGEQNPTVRGEDGLRALTLANQIKQYIADRKSV